jgi:hypothetical protein
MATMTPMTAFTALAIFATVVFAARSALAEIGHS